MHHLKHLRGLEGSKPRKNATTLNKTLWWGLVLVGTGELSGYKIMCSISDAQVQYMHLPEGLITACGVM